MLSSATRPTWAEVSAEALAANYRRLAAAARRAGAAAVAVIKADAYGHGADAAIPVLASEGCEWFAVTCLDEARRLQPLLKPYRTLLLSGLFPGEAGEIVAHGMTPVLGTEEQLSGLVAALPAQAEGPGFPVHLEIDTGMSRQGLPWDDAAAWKGIARALERAPSLRVEAVMTHFASADDAASPQTAAQITRLRTALAALRELGIRPECVHAGGSATLFDAEQLGALQHTAREAGARLLLRPGISLYGYGPAAGEHGLRPILAWKSRITAVRRIAAGEAVSYNATYRVDRPSLIALLPVGYADGYSRLLSNRGSVLVQGRRAPVAGRVTMDQTMVDVTDIPAARPGDEVVLIGSQGAETITADELATAVGTISYEVLCALGWRVPRLWSQQPRGGVAGGGALRS